MPSTDPLSNFLLADLALLSKVPARHHAMDGEACDADGYDDVLSERFHRELRFDFAIVTVGWNTPARLPLLARGLRINFSQNRRPTAPSDEFRSA